MKKETIIFGIIVLYLAFTMQQKGTFSVLPSEEESTFEECFDYIDNDNDGFYDLDDSGCEGFGYGDYNNNGILDLEEYEEGTLR